MPEFYRISEVAPKSGFMRDVHHEVLGARCYPLEINEGERGWIKFYDKYDRCYHTLHTSTIESVDVANNGDITIITRNTKYVLTKEVSAEAVDE